MSKPRNPNPPVRTQLVKNKKAKDTVWYVVERKVQYCHEKQTNKVLDSRVIGILKNKEDDYKDMIPIDEWNEQQKTEKKKNKATNDMRNSEKAGCTPQQLFVLLMAAFLSGFTDSTSAAEFLNAHKDEIAQIMVGPDATELSHDCIRRFFLLTGKDISEELLHEFEQLSDEESSSGEEKQETVQKIRGLITSVGNTIRDCRESNFLYDQLASRDTEPDKRMKTLFDQEWQARLYYECKMKEAYQEGFKIAFKEATKKGMLAKLVSLMQKGKLTEAEAAGEAGMTVADFKKAATTLA